MENLIGNKLDEGSIEHSQGRFIMKEFIIFLVFYILFLITQFTDLVVEMLYKDNDLYYFYYLRLLFFGISTLMQVIYILLGITMYSVKEKALKANAVQNKITSTFVKIYVYLFCIWTIFFLVAGIPRLIIFLKNREKIGTFISILIYVKIALLFPIYLLFIISYNIGRKDKNKEK